jgi:hypothetical protein
MIIDSAQQQEWIRPMRTAARADIVRNLLMGIEATAGAGSSRNQ